MTLDQKLVESARAGDRKALEALLERQQERIYRFGRKLCKDPEDARDVLQNTLLTMARSIGDFRGSSSLSTWLYSIARSFCHKQRNRSKFAPTAQVPLDSPEAASARAAPDAARPPDEAAAARELGAALSEAIKALDPDQREVLVLRDVEGLKASEVAEITGLSVAAVKSRLHRARLGVRHQLAPLLASREEAAPASSCPDVLMLYSKHLEGEIDSEACRKMERHLSECPRCERACDSLKRTLHLCRNMPSAEVPKGIQDSVRTALREFLVSS